MSIIKLIGDAPNQVSRNKALGDLAFQDAASIAGSLTAGSINNTPIGSTTASTGAFTTLTSTSDATINGVRVGRGNGNVSTNTAVGTSAINAAATGASNTAVGTTALRDVTSGISNTALGASALIQSTTGDYNTALGSNAMFANTSGGSSVAIGFQSLYFNTTGTFNNALGRAALNANTTGANNIGIGSSALQAITTTSNNTAVGHSAGSLITTGAKNTLLGCYTGNQGGLDIRTLSNYVVLSDGDGNPRIVVNNVGNVGIGTVSPTANLHVVGTEILETNGNTGSLSFNAFGNFVGQIRTPYSGSAYNILAFNVISGGSTIFSNNNVEHVRINSSGSVGIGTTTPQAKLDVNGNARFGSFDINSSESKAIWITGSNFGFGTFYGTALQLLTSNTERMRITGAGDVGIGVVTPATKLDVSGAIRTSTGILFGTDTAAANTLNDYEEGTWTPTFAFSGASVDATYYAQTGTYTKIGNTVVAEGRIYINTKGSSTGNFELRGFPFVANDYSAVSLSVNSGMNYTGMIFAFMNISEARVSFTQMTEAGVSSNITQANINTPVIVFTCTYTTNA